MSNGVTLEYYGIEARGRNVTEAKREAGRLLTEFVKNYRPRYVKVGDSIAVITAIPEGGTRVEYPLSLGEWRGDQCSSGFSGDDVETAIARAVLHLATGCNLGVNHPAWLQIGNRTLRNIQRHEYLRHEGFQKAYAAAIANDTPENQRHQWACENQGSYTSRELGVIG